MIKRYLVLATALMSLHGISSATECSGAGCNVTVNTTVNVDLNYDLSGYQSGIYTQNNSGDMTATTNLQNVIMRDNGNITATTVAIGNSLSLLTENSGTMVPVKFISQINGGDGIGKTILNQASTSVAGAVDLTTVAIGNSASISNTGASAATAIANLSANQCNTGNMTATTNYNWDPTSLKATTVAIGNSFSVTRK